MSKISWGNVGDRYFELGVDRGVLYVEGRGGVPWNGLISVTQNPSGGESEPFYIDGFKYLNIVKKEEFTGTIEAYTYPDEFSECDGLQDVGAGLFVDQQYRKSFGLSYRTRVGNDTDGIENGYKIHLVYNALASPSSRSFSSMSDSLNPINFSWSFTTKPVFIGPSMRPSAHFVIDSRKTKPETLAKIENRLYGTATTNPGMIPISELIPMFPTLKITDNGDGTWTATGTDYEISMLDRATFQIKSDTITYLDEDTYTVSSVQN